MKRSLVQTVVLSLVLATSTVISLPMAEAASRTRPTRPSRAVEVRDSTGTVIKLAKPAVRVVCLTGICTDTLFTAGLRPVAATDSLHLSPLYYGDSGKDIARVGGSFFEPSLEDIAKAKPDLVIGLAGVHDKLRTGLAKIAPLYISGPSGLKGMAVETTNIGRLVGKEREITAANTALSQRIADISSKIPSGNRKKVVAIFGSDANIGASTLDEPTIDALAHITTYGFTARASGHNFPKFTLDDLLKLDPDAIFVTTIGFGPTPPKPVSEQLAGNPIWSKLKAVQAGAVYEVDFQVWVTTRGIRGSNAVLDEAVKKLYPTL